MDYPSVDASGQGLARRLDERIGQAAARAHAALAGVALAAAEFDEINGWCAPGIRSFEHWLAIAAGFDLRTGAELLRVGRALKALPLTARAFEAGRLSFDKARHLTKVATPATEDMFLEIARGASGSQLARICGSMRRIAGAEAPGHDRELQAERGLWTELDEDGMMRLVARLPPEDGAVVMRAIEAITAANRVPDGSRAEAEDPAQDPWAARQADALVSLCESVLSGGAPALVGAGATRQVVVHVDVGVLTGEAPDGRCHLEGGAPLSREAARRIGCDADVVAVTERDGLPIDVGRKMRFPSAALRRALEVRDRFCRFPGCGVPAHRTQAHHIRHWPDGGPTDRDNLLLLCGFHHHRLHEGGYVIRKAGHEIAFETHDGHVIGAREPAPMDSAPARTFHFETARAEWGGEAMDLEHTLFVLAHNSRLAEARAAPD